MSMPNMYAIVLNRHAQKSCCLNLCKQILILFFKHIVLNEVVKKKSLSLPTWLYLQQCLGGEVNNRQVMFHLSPRATNKSWWNVERKRLGPFFTLLFSSRWYSWLACHWVKRYTGTAVSHSDFPSTTSHLWSAMDVSNSAAFPPSFFTPRVIFFGAFKKCCNGSAIALNGYRISVL